MADLLKRYEKLALILIVFLAFILRFTSLSNFPGGFNADEASFGYDAYSIIKTGKDQWGNSLPLVLKSFGDFKSPLYSYLSTPFIAALGLNKFAVRLPNVFVGTLAVFVTYLLIREVLDRYKKSFDIKEYIAPSLVGAFLLAVSPWHVMMSRGGFESNLITLFLPLGIYFFLKGLNNSTYLIYSSIFLGLNLFTYHSAKLITPLVVIGLLFIFWKEVKKLKIKTLVISSAIFLLFFLDIIYTFKIGGGSRIAERSITQGALLEGAETKIKLIQNGANPVVAKLFHNKYQVVIRRFISNYHQYFSQKFWFNKGAGESSYGMIPGIGVVNIFEGILILGTIFLLFKKDTRKILLVFIAWLLITPLPAALATGVGYSGNRALGMIPVIQILGAFGFIGWSMVLKRVDKKLLYIAIIIFVLSVGVQINNFKNEYFKSQSNSILGGMLYGSLETSEWLMKNSSDKKVFISRTLSEPQIFVAFANKWDPSDFQKQTLMWGFDNLNITWVDQIPEYSVGKYIFKSLEWKIDSQVKNTLVVGKPNEFPKDIVPLKTFYYPDGEASIYVVDPEQKVFANAL